VIGIERMPHPEQKSEQDDREIGDGWLLCRLGPVAVENIMVCVSSRGSSSRLRYTGVPSVDQS